MKKHLLELENESISIIRDTFVNSDNPVVMYSIGKDSSVLIELFAKAFYPLPIPAKVLHVDTTWKFKEMISFKYKIQKKYNLDLITHTNLNGVKENVTPFNNTDYTEIMKTKALLEALDKFEFDMIYGGARRDEEASRSKEKVLSHRNEYHIWDPLNQRIEPWHLFNTYKKPKESFRVFPLSNWTELNIWEYIKDSNLDIVPLYFAKEREVVKRGEEYFLLDDDRFETKSTDIVEVKKVRFRTLGCYPLTSGIESNADTLDKIINELKSSNSSERAGRLIDLDKEASMELKKRKGYF